jgi:hypothetical protein
VAAVAVRGLGSLASNAGSKATSPTTAPPELLVVVHVGVVVAHVEVHVVVANKLVQVIPG